MPRRSDSREQMVKTAATLLRRQGYAATGWRQVVAESRTPWGSQAHHFPGGKEQLACEALARAGGGYERMLRRALAGTHPADAVAAWAQVAAAGLEASDWADGCPVATVALETAHASDALATACRNALTGWQAALAEAVVARGVPESEATSLATLTLAGIEGGLLLARAQRDPAPLAIVGRELADLLRARVP